MRQDASPGRTPAGSPPHPVPARVGTRTLALVVTTALAMIPAHGQTPPTPSGSGPALAYRLPVDDVVLRRFERPAQRWSRGHRGVDISATVGTQVLAPADGVVTFSGPVAGRGVLTIEHPGGLRSSLEPVAGGVGEGTVVLAGAVVGTVDDGGTHCGPVDCLHWGVRRGAEYLDPLSLLPGASPVVLLAQGVSSDHSPGG